MQASFNFIGSHVNAWRVFESNELIFTPKAKRVAGILSIVDECEVDEELRPQVAASLLGKLTHLGGQLAGRILRGCERTLVDRQHSERTEITKEGEYAFAFVRAALRGLPPRSISL